MPPVTWDLPPAFVACAILLIAATTQVTLGRVPNVLTMLGLGTGLMFAWLTQEEGSPLKFMLASSLACTVTALAILVVPFARHQLGAGSVKAQMAFAAWIGSAAPLPVAVSLVAVASLAGLMVTFVMVRGAAASIPDDEQALYEYPAQVPLSLVAILATVGALLVTSTM